jgi:formiminotetrahydrofolate cyclodeaminase
VSKYSKLTVGTLLDRFASSEPVPGGGSAAALAGAVGASLLVMVAGLPRTRNGTPQERTSLNAAAARVKPLRDELMSLIDRDSEAYTSVMKAFRLPKSNEAERAVRTIAIDVAMRAATEAPLATMRACHQVMREAPAIIEHGAQSAASDAGVAIELLNAAVRGAALNVDTNIAGMKDAEYVGRVTRERRDIEQAIAALLLPRR